MNEDRPLTALERQGVDSGTTVFNSVEEMREAEAEFQAEHEAVIAALESARQRKEDEDFNEDDSDLNDYDDLVNP